MPKENKYHTFYIILGPSGGLGYGGVYGRGHTLADARKGYRRNGGDRATAKLAKEGRYKEFICIAELPFPEDMAKDAQEGEADAWVTGMGGITTLRCELVELK